MDPALETGWLRQEARWLSAERRFLVATVDDFYRAGLYEVAWRLAFYLTPLFELGAHHDDWHATTAIGLDAARAAGHRQGEALLLRGLADLHRAEGRTEAAAAALRAAQPLAEGLELARITLRLGLVQTLQSQPRPGSTHPSPQVAQAEQAFVRALSAFEEACDRRGRADALRALGALRQDEPLLRESLAAYRDLRDPRGAAEALLVLAAVARAEGALDAAASAAREALETFTQYGDRRNAAQALMLVARTALDSDDTDGAVDALVRAMGEFDGLGDQEGKAEAVRLAQEARRRRGQRI